MDPLTGQPKTEQHVENVDIRTRVNARVEERAKMYGHPCECPCNCRTRHRFGKLCVLCQRGDCWTDLDSYLAKIEERKQDREAEQNYHQKMDEETFNRLYKEESL